MTQTRHFVVPIWLVDVWVVVTDSVPQAYRRLPLTSEDDPLESNYDGLCSYRGRNIALFFNRRALNLELFSHEVFHATHRILEAWGDPIKPDHHEHGAALHAWLMTRVRKALGKYANHLGPRFDSESGGYVRT